MSNIITHAPRRTQENDEHPAWCHGHHGGTFHSSPLIDEWTTRADGHEASVSLAWDGALEGDMSSEPPLVQVVAPEFLTPADARRLAEAIVLACALVTPVDGARGE